MCGSLTSSDFPTAYSCMCKIATYYTHLTHRPQVSATNGAEHRTSSQPYTETQPPNPTTGEKGLWGSSPDPFMSSPGHRPPLVDFEITLAQFTALGLLLLQIRRPRSGSLLPESLACSGQRDFQISDLGVVSNQRPTCRPATKK